MATIDWNAPDGPLAEADEVARIVDLVAPAAEVCINVRADGWSVRALLPAAMCGQGGVVAARDVSRKVAEALRDAGYPAL
jgi:hypothetical protein